MKLLALILVLSMAVVCAANFGRRAESAPVADKPTAEEIIKKHLDSIGTPEARGAINSRIIIGNAKVTFKSRGTAQTEGAVVLASDGAKSMITMKFEVTQYPYEKIGFDGQKVTAYQINPGDYTSLGAFIRSSQSILKEGLFGGTLSSAWPLLDLNNRNAKLEYTGTKKLNSRPAVELRYLPRGGADVRISLFFDAETFQHVRTTYKKEISAQMSRGGLGNTQAGADRTGERSASQTGTIYELIEDFSDFKTEGGVALPHTYKIHLIQQGSATQLSDWEMTLVRFLFNQKLEAKDFDVSTE